MKTTITLFALAVSFSVFSQGIQFIEAKTDSDLAIVNQRAGEEKKLIFIDCYTTWCDPCKWMEKNVFTNDTVARFFNENFICVRMDMEKGIGISRTYKYEVYAYPTLIFIGPEGIAHRAAGARDVKGLMELGETALNPEKRFSHWQGKYKQGDREPAFIREYLKQLNAAGMETKETADWYFASISENDLLSAANFEIMDMFISGYYVAAPDNKLFDLVLKNKDKYCEIAGKETVEKMIYRVFENAPYYDYKADSATRGYVPVYENGTIEKIIAKINQTDFAGREKLTASLNIALFKEKKEWQNYESAAIKFVNTYLMNDFNSLNYYAWTFYENENIKSKEAINAAIGWAKKAFELSNEWDPADTYAAILYKSGNKKEALKAAESAIALGKKTGQDTAPTEELLEKIKKMKFQ